MVECYTQCYNEQDCDYFAYNETAQICLFVKGTVGNEAISRFIFEGWTYGRIGTTNQRVNIL